MLKFFKCKKCGKIVEVVNEGCPVVVCCGEEMTELKANTNDGATEKHVPVITVGEVTDSGEYENWFDQYAVLAKDLGL